jgi:hypothetical protein
MDVPLYYLLFFNTIVFKKNSVISDYIRFIPSHQTPSFNRRFFCFVLVCAGFVSLSEDFHGFLSDAYLDCSYVDPSSTSFSNYV